MPGAVHGMTQRNNCAELHLLMPVPEARICLDPKSNERHYTWKVKVG
jgi:hypothetical protein